MIRVAKINLYVKLMKAQGVSVRKLLAKTHIDPKLLSNPDGNVTLEMYYAVIMNMIRLSGNPAIAFSLGEMIDISDFGILGYAMLSSTNMGQLVRIRQQYQNSLFGTMVNITSAQGYRSGFEITISSTALTETLRRFETEEFLAEGVRLMKIFTGVTPVIRSVSFAYAKPSYGARYKSFFKCPLEFDAPQTVFRVKAPHFETPVQSGNPELHNVCAQHCQQVMQSLPDSGKLRARLRDLFLGNPGNLPNLQAAGIRLGISERHLRRKLEADGLSYQALKDEFRLDLSRQLLAAGKLTPKEVSYLLGYSGPSAFSRAFKIWTGKTVQQFVRSSS